MKIYPSKSAMLVRSVDRRNAVSAQEPKKFALSSQRKLSVLLVVGIIILSAKECEMDPMGPGGNKPVTFAYICTNGTAAGGTTGTEDTEKCSACNTSFELTSDNECVDETFAYICTNGTIAGGTTGTENTEKCSSCETGFELTSSNACVVDTTPPAIVTDLIASLPVPSVGTVQLDWTEPANTDFSHLLISWTPNAPTNPIRVNKRTTTTIIPASGLTSGTPYTFTAVSVDATGNPSAASTGATATPVSCPAVLFATTDGTTYAGSVNVASGSGSTSDPYLIPLIDGVLTTCSIEIEFDHLGKTLTGGLTDVYFHIDNMPIGASYTSSTFAWTLNSATISGETLQFRISSNGLLSNLDIAFSVIKGREPDMGMVIHDSNLSPTDGRTFGLDVFTPAIADSLTFTLTP